MNLTTDCSAGENDWPCEQPVLRGWAAGDTGGPWGGVSGSRPSQCDLEIFPCDAYPTYPVSQHISLKNNPSFRIPHNLSGARDGLMASRRVESLRQLIDDTGEEEGGREREGRWRDG